MKQFIARNRAEIDAEIRKTEGRCTDHERELMVDNVKDLYLKAKRAGVYREEEMTAKHYPQGRIVPKEIDRYPEELIVFKHSGGE
jgi:hypothetical protein